MTSREITGCDECGKDLKGCRKHVIRGTLMFFVFCSRECVEAYLKRAPKER